MLLTFLAFVSPAAAQKFLVRTYTEADGLPGSSFNGVTQDGSGRMWFPFRRGVVVFDGKDWLLSPLETGDTLDRCHRIVFDKSGEGWSVSNQNQWRLSHFDGSRWERMPASGAPIAELDVQTSLAVIGTKPSVLVAVGTPVMGLWTWDGSTWRAYGEKEGLPSPVIRTLAASGDRIWIGTDKGIALLKNGKVTARPDLTAVMPSPMIWGLAAERLLSGERIWVVGRDWVGIIEGERLRVLDREIPIEFQYEWKQLAAAPDRRGGLFFGTTAGLFHLNGTTGERISLGLSTGLPTPGGTDLWVDREGILWVSSVRGISKLSSLRFSNWDTSQGMLEDEVSSILERSSGDMVFGHATGLTFIDRSGRPRPYALDRLVRDPVDRRIMDLDEGPDGSLWLVETVYGVARIDPQGRLNWVPIVDRRDGRMVSVRRDHTGTIWAGGDKGLFRFDGNQFVPEPLEHFGLINIRRILADSEGTLYLALAGNGLLFRRGGQWIHARSPERQDFDQVSAVVRGSSGRVFVGTWAGLLELKGTTLARPPESALDIRRPIYFLVEDQKHRIWMGTNNGVIRWDGTDRVHFTAKEGLLGNETNRSAGVVDRKGRVWIGTERGVSCYVEKHALLATPPPLVTLVTFETGEAELPPEADYRLAYGQTRIHFDVRAISFLDEDGVHYRYKLEGFDPDWVEAMSTTHYEARYASLPPGTYRLLLQAKSGSSDWSPVVRSGLITIRPPFWRQWWFLGAILLGVAFIAAAVQRYVSARGRARTLEIEVQRRTEALAASERRVKEEHERLAITLGSIADGVVACDAAGAVRLINRAGEALTGWPSADAVGKSIEDILSLREESNGTPKTGLMEALKNPEGNGFFEKPLVLRALSGGERLIELRASPLLTEKAEARGYVIALEDVSVKQRLAEERARLERLDALGMVAGGIANDFNNLLAGILGSLSLLRESVRLNDYDLEQVARAEQAVEQSRRVTHKLLTFARGGTPVRAPVPLFPMVQDLVSRSFPESVGRFTLDMSPDLRPVDIDEGQVATAIQSLLANALEAGGRKGEVVVRARNVDLTREEIPGLGPGPYVRLSVEDKGPGIPHEVLPRIFDPFFTTKPGGSGLGLAVAHSIARNHSGALTVENVPGDGATFHLFLPASEVPAAAAAAVLPRKIKARVLVMDDQDIVRNVARAMLKQMGCEPVTAEEGGEALRLFEEAARAGKPFDLVILDLSVPSGMDGPETIQQLRMLDPGVKAVASSGYSDDAILAHPEAAGFVAILPKPYTMKDLRSVLEKTLNPEEQ